MRVCACALVCFCVSHCRLSVGVSCNGMMQGPSGCNSNVMIASFGSGSGSGSATVGEYDMMGYATAQIVSSVSGGVGNTSAYQSGGMSVMRWSRYANNGDSNDAQISLTGVTNVVWAYGLSGVYSGSPLPPMGNTVVDLSGVASASSSISVSASPSPSESSGYVAPSQSPAPSPMSWSKSAELTTGLTLSWNRVDDRFDFEAVYAGLAW